MGVALAFQIVFLIIASDPIKYRLLMPASIVEKFVFVIPTFYLYTQGRVAGPILGGAALDLLWGTLFNVSYFKVAGKQHDVALASELEN